jgi:hypothetical protein
VMEVRGSGDKYEADVVAGKQLLKFVGRERYSEARCRPFGSLQMTAVHRPHGRSRNTREARYGDHRAEAGADDADPDRFISCHCASLPRMVSGVTQQFNIYCLTVSPGS